MVVVMVYVGLIKPGQNGPPFKQDTRIRISSISPGRTAGVPSARAAKHRTKKDLMYIIVLVVAECGRVAQRG